MSENTETEAKPSGGKMKLILIIVLPLLLLLGGGGAAYLMGMVPGLNGPDAHAEAAGAPAEEDPADVVFVDLPDMLVNLNSGGRRLRYLKIAAALEVRGEEQAERVRLFVPRILDSFQLYLRAIRPEELEGAEGVYRIKEELLVRINDAVQPAKVRDILVREMLVQ